MKHILGTTLIIGTLAFSALNTRACDTNNNFYLNLDGGGLFQQKMQFVQSVPGFSHSDTVTFNPGGRVNLDLGYNLNKTIAVEFESGLLWNSIDRFGISTLSRFDETVNQYTVPMIVNVVYHIPGAGKIDPYVGVGAGGVLNVVDFRGGNGRDVGTDLAFAYQAEVGFKYALCRHTSLGLAYKFLAELDQTYGYYGETVQFKGIFTHAVMLSLTWQF